jgi:hypothetical protein
MQALWQSRKRLKLVGEHAPSAKGSYRWGSAKARGAPSVSQCYACSTAPPEGAWEERGHGEERGLRGQVEVRKVVGPPDRRNRGC